MSNSKGYVASSSQGDEPAGLKGWRRWDDTEAEMFGHAPETPEKELWRAVLAQGLKEAFQGKDDALRWIAHRGDEMGSPYWIASRTGLEFLLAKCRRELFVDRSRIGEIAKRVTGSRVGRNNQRNDWARRA